MNTFFRITAFITVFLLLALIKMYSSEKYTIEDSFITYIVDTGTSELKMYWKDDQDKIIGNFDNLKKYVEGQGQNLLFAMNGGMYTTDFGPLGLYIQDQKMLHALNTRSGKANFYLKPNGVFYLTTQGKAVVCKTEDFKLTKKIQYATQSGPMLVINGKIHPAFNKKSVNLNIRNGVGILPDQRVLFVISRQQVSFYEFAQYFQEMGCKNALYLDGFVSRIFLPELGYQFGGDFGVIIGLTGPGE